jgi:osmoprotectant transport system permease protein
LLALSALIGGGVPALGFLPAWLALTLYALLPILRNVVAGLQGIDPAVLQAADAVGMTPRQRLRLVEAPLAAPVAMAGIRTAAVWTIGAATLATTVGYPSLGNPIFAGLQIERWDLVLAGCMAAALLALVTDGLLGLIERGIGQRRRSLTLAGLGLLVLGLLLACLPLLHRPERTVTIGAKNFSEQYILARLIGRRLEQAGYHVSYREGLGSAVAFRALQSGDIDVYVEYSGTLWAGTMGRKDTPSRQAMLDGIAAWMAAGPKTALIGPASKMPMRSRFDRTAASPPSRTSPPKPPPSRLVPILNSSTGPNGARSAMPMASASRRPAPTAPPSCTARCNRGRPTQSRLFRPMAGSPRII